MRYLAFLCGAGLTLLAQSTNQTAPIPNPYGPGIRANQPTRNITQRPLRTGRFRGGGIFLGGNTHEVIVEVPAPVKEDPLKDLVISPVYQRDKISPKMIEIP